MHRSPFRYFATFLASLLTFTVSAQVPEVKEHRFSNGFQILLVERPGSGAFHARLVVRGGRADTGSLPAVTAEILARTLFCQMLPEEVGADGGFEALLKEEEGLFEALRLARIRRARQQGQEASPEEQGLAQLHARRLVELKAKLETSVRRDPLVALGATRRGASSGADELAMSLDMPSLAFNAWCHLEQQRLRAMGLFRFPLERERLIRELAGGGDRNEGNLSILLGTAFSGHPYAQTYDLQRGSLEGLTWSDLRTFARNLLSPERMTLILVGDLDMASILPVVKASFGTLPPTPEGRGRREDRNMELPEAQGYRRLQASTSGDPLVFIAWRIPPANHPDSAALRILAQALGGSKGARLARRLQEERGLARMLTVRFGVPGGRDPSLLIIEAHPAEGHGLVELEEAIHGEILRVQRELFPEEDLRRAQRSLETELLMAQEDAASLATTLGGAVAQSGDWRQAFRSWSLGRNTTPEEIQAIVRRYLVSGQEVRALLEADPLHAPQDPLEAKLGKVLLDLLQRKLEDPAQVESVVRETLRQLRMLSVPERAQTLKLLEAQTGS